MSSELSRLLGTAGRKAEILAKMAPIPPHMVSPRVGISNVKGLGITVVVADEISQPQVWHPVEERWVDLQV